jgi:protein AbiQ
MGGLSSELLLALSKKLNSECFATLSANITGAGFAACLFCWRDSMDNIKFYEINEAYIDYLSPHAPHLFHNSKKSQTNTRKYLGVVLRVNDMDYFAPLSSHKAKHDKMKESLDFLKVGRYAVINLNNMFPVPEKECHYVDFSVIKDKVYKDLLLAEYRIVKQMHIFVANYVACGGAEVDGVDYFIAKKILRKFEQLNLAYIRDEIDGYVKYLDQQFGKEHFGVCKEYLLRLKKMI